MDATGGVPPQRARGHWCAEEHSACGNRTREAGECPCGRWLVLECECGDELIQSSDWKALVTSALEGIACQYWGWCGGPRQHAYGCSWTVLIRLERPDDGQRAMQRLDFAAGRRDGAAGGLRSLVWRSARSRRTCCWEDLLGSVFAFARSQESDVFSCGQEIGHYLPAADRVLCAMASAFKKTALPVQIVLF